MEIQSMERFLEYYEGIRQRTRRVVERIPDDRMEWRHAPGRFSFGDLVRHLAAMERYMFAENVAGRPSSYPGHGPELAAGPEAVRRYFEEMHAESVEVFRGLADEELRRRCVTPAGVSMAVWKWLRAMVEHEVHHRGQLYLMLGMVGASAPPIFGLTSEEVRERSAGAPPPAEAHGSAPPGPAPRSRPEALALEFFARVWGGAHDLDAIDELMTGDYAITSGGRTIRGREEFKAWVRDFQALLLDARNETLEVFTSASGDRVVSRWVCSGLNNGIFGLEPDSRPISFTGIAVWSVRDGRLAECWVERSALEAYRGHAEERHPSPPATRS
ncbi:MAG TPA: DinB family protein [Longimicrobiaceae bacterium]|nr:DinB family protein [Longimicrobiaceae bacterium]